MTTSARAASPISRNSRIFRSSRSGAASWMKSAAAAISRSEVVKASLPRRTGLCPISRSIEGQAVSMAALSFGSAAATGS
jgi:hypothetical protein